MVSPYNKNKVNAQRASLTSSLVKNALEPYIVFGKAGICENGTMYGKERINKVFIEN